MTNFSIELSQQNNRASRIQPYIRFPNQENLLHILQSGFRHQHSTCTALVHLIDKVYNDTDNFKITGGLFLELLNVFDTVNHDIMLKKFARFNTSEKMSQWLLSYLSCRKQGVDFNCTLSNAATIYPGVPQRSILGPLLFLIYVNDLPANRSSEVMMFADDTTVLSHGTSHRSVSTDMQSNLDKIYDYAVNNRLVPYPKKTKAIIFSKRSQATQFEERESLTLAQNNIEYAHSYKCFGLFLMIIYLTTCISKT